MMQQNFRSSNPSPSPKDRICMHDSYSSNLLCYLCVFVCVGVCWCVFVCVCVTSRAVEIWQKLISHPEWWTKTSENGRKKSIMSLVWSAHLRFFSLMMMAAKVPEVVGLVKKSLAVLNYSMS